MLMMMKYILVIFNNAVVVPEFPVVQFHSPVGLHSNRNDWLFEASVNNACIAPETSVI